MIKERQMNTTQMMTWQAVRQSIATTLLSAATGNLNRFNLNRLTLTAALGINPLPPRASVNRPLRLRQDCDALILPAEGRLKLRATWNADGSCRWHAMSTQPSVELP